MKLLIELNKIWAFAARNLLVNRRNVFALFEMLFWPAIGILSVGLLTRFLNLDQETVTFVLIGAVSMNAVQIAQLDLSYALLYDIWAKSVKHEFIAPIRLYHLLVGSGLVGLGRGLLVFAVMGLLSMVFFNMDLSRPGILGLVLFLGGLFLNAGLVGVLVLILVLRFGHRAEVAAWAFSYFLLLLCGLYYPVNILPPGVRELAYVIPLTYFLDYFRHFYGFSLLSPQPLVFGYTLSVLFLIISYLLLRATLKGARRRGTLLKLSE